MKIFRREVWIAHQNYWCVAYITNVFSSLEDHFFQIINDNNKEKTFQYKSSHWHVKFFFLTVIEILSSSNLFPIFLFPSRLIQCYRVVICQNWFWNLFFYQPFLNTLFFKKKKKKILINTTEKIDRCLINKIHIFSIFIFIKQLFKIGSWFWRYDDVITSHTYPFFLEDVH